MYRSMDRSIDNYSDRYMGGYIDRQINTYRDIYLYIEIASQIKNNDRKNGCNSAPIGTRRPIFHEKTLKTIQFNLSKF